MLRHRGVYARLDPFCGDEGDTAGCGGAGIRPERLPPVEELPFLFRCNFIRCLVELHFTEVHVPVLPLQHKVDLRSLLPIFTT